MEVSHHKAGGALWRGGGYIAKVHLHNVTSFWVAFSVLTYPYSLQRSDNSFFVCRPKGQQLDTINTMWNMTSQHVWWITISHYHSHWRPCHLCRREKHHSRWQATRFLEWSVQDIKRVPCVHQARRRAAQELSFTFDATDSSGGFFPRPFDCENLVIVWWPCVRSKGLSSFRSRNVAGSSTLVLTTDKGLQLGIQSTQKRIGEGEHFENLGFAWWRSGVWFQRSEMEWNWQKI